MKHLTDESFENEIPQNNSGVSKDNVHVVVLGDAKDLTWMHIAYVFVWFVQWVFFSKKESIVSIIYTYVSKHVHVMNVYNNINMCGHVLQTWLLELDFVC